MTSSADNPAHLRSRLVSLDIIRGVVMVLMALDHVRVFAGVPAGGPDPAVFFTRWVTNFCAPAFVFLAGTGAFLHAVAVNDRRAMSRYLLVRGVLLIVLEMTISRLSWTFNFDFYNYTEANVLWVIGWSMIGMAALIHLPLRWITVFGLAMMAGHNLLDGMPQSAFDAIQHSSFSGFWQVLYAPFSEFRFFGNGPMLVVLYTIVPWVGVMAAGYGFGVVLQFDEVRRRAWCLCLGLGATVLFVVLRALNTYGNPWPWGSSDNGLSPLLSFLAVNKYPASLQFLLMTLGPTIAAIPLLERVHSYWADWLTVFGRTPMYYYLLHLPLIHFVAVLISLVRSPAATPWLFLNHPLRIPPPPDGYMWSLPLLYAVTALVVVMLYFPCRWYAARKARGPRNWFTTYI
ncbi:MAG: DUF1624 domain-containing protein [Gemmatimonadaceae bacterium]|nr:DUF1624 domain-containing protein [Gemmatimonadaceae bacterium]